MKVIKIVFLFLLIASACKTKTTTNQTKESHANSKFSKLESGAHSNIYERKNYVIKTQHELDKLYNNLNQTRLPKITTPIIDFEKKSVLVLLMGGKSTGGHAITIDHLGDVKGNLVVYFKETHPKGMATAVMTQPYYIAETNKITGEVKFIKVDY